MWHLIIDAFFVFASFCFVVVHVVGRIRLSRRFFLADYLLVLSWICCMPSDIFIHFFSYYWGFGDSRLRFSAGNLPLFDIAVTKNHIVNGLKMSWAQQLGFAVGLCSIKLVFLLTYRRLFPQRLMTAVNVTIAAVVVGYVAAFAMTLFWCLPIDRNWSRDPQAHCMSVVALPPLFFGIGLHLSSDVVRMEVSRGIRVMFSFGFICVLLVVVRAILLTSFPTNQAIINNIWTFELAAPLIVASLPLARRLWKTRKDLVGSVVELPPREEHGVVEREVGHSTGQDLESVSINTNEKKVGTIFTDVLAN